MDKENKLINDEELDEVSGGDLNGASMALLLLKISFFFNENPSATLEEGYVYALELMGSDSYARLQYSGSDINNIYNAVQQFYNKKHPAG